jgi:ABC-2 type transport system permease protein
MMIELLLSGRLVPLTLMPDWTQTLANFLPFKWTFFYPIQCLAGDLSNEELLAGLAAQAFWIVAGLGMFLIAWRYAIRRFSAVGG